MKDETRASPHLSTDRAGLLAEPGDAPVSADPRSAPRGPQPLSFAQERLWLIDRLEPGTSLYNTRSAWRLRGHVNADVMREAVADVLSRHESLRMRITESDTRLEQQVVSVEPPFEHLDFSDLDPVAADREAMAAVRTCADRPFDLSLAPFIRAVLATISPEESILLIVVHHIATDGWSMGILARDLSLAYTARLANRLPDWVPLATSYADYAYQQRQRLRGANLQRLIDYWKRHLDGLEAIELPCDFDRSGNILHPGAQVGFDLPAATVESVRAMARSNGATEFMTLLATLHVLLWRLGAAPDHAVGSPVAGRMQLDHENIVGFFVNTLVMRTQLEGGMTFREVLAHTRSRVLDAIDHQELPFEKLVSELNPVREPGRNPLFQVGFAFQNTPSHRLELPGVEAEGLSTGGSLAKFDLHFSVVPQGSRMRGTLEYSADLFTEQSAQNIVRCFVNLLSSACATPDKPIAALDLLDAEQLHLLRNDWAGHRSAYQRDAAIDRLFLDRVALHPDAVALEQGGERTTYAALDHRAQTIRDALTGAGITRGTRVGIMLHRSVDMVAGMLATLETGAAWVPLDPAWPAERLQFLARDAGINALLTNTALLRESEDLAPVVIDTDLLGDVRPRPRGPAENSLHDGNDVAAIFYTSGSTGTPKGVAVTHRNIIRLVCGQDYVPFGPGLRFLLHSPASFDASTFELWGALLHGAVCVIAPDDVVEVPILRRTLIEHRVDVLWLTASLFNLVIDEEPDALAGVRWLLTGGESLSVAHVRRAQAALPRTTLINGYGPTETTTFACCFTIPRALPTTCRSIPIGRPLANTTCFVVDDNTRLCPPGVEGELLIGGDGLTAGYLNRPDLDSDRFVTLEVTEGMRVYRSGDRVRWLHDGTLEFRGRTDDQIKLRGFRIEPGEVTTVLLENPAIGQAAAMVREDQPGARRLVAYATGPTLDPEAELERLRRRLPAYMVPSSLVVLDRLPLTANGKVDRSGLPPPGKDPALPSGATPPVQPRDDAERLLAEIWSELFERKDIGIHDNFFALGGHSLLASRACLRIGRQFGVDVPMSALFRGPTIAQLAEHLRSLGPSRALSMQHSTTMAIVRPSLHGDYVLCVGGRIAELLQTLPGDIGILFLGSGEGDPVEFHRRGIDGAVDAHAREIAKISPLRKLVVTGFSYGGLVAYALAAHLRQKPGASVDAVLLEPSIRTGPAWDLPAPVKRVSRYAGRVFREGPAVIWKSIHRRLQSPSPETPPPERTRTAGERAWMLVGPHMRRNVRRYRPQPTPSDGIHLVFGTDWMRTHYPAFTALCTARPSAHPVGRIRRHHDLVDDPRCIAVWRDLIGRLFT